MNESTEEFYGLFGNKALLVLETPYAFRELQPGDEVIISNGRIVGEHITSATSYVDIRHACGIPFLEEEEAKLLPPDFPTEEAYGETMEERWPEDFLGETNWQLYSMLEALEDKHIIFTKNHRRMAALFRTFVLSFIDEEED